MNPDLPAPTDPAFNNIVKQLLRFYNTDIVPDETGLAVKRRAEAEAREVLKEALDMVERFAQNRSAIAKYDLLKYLSNKKQEVRLYK